jgi:hypothetical protein
MLGNERKRHCGECKLNVYNLSNMTHREAENLLINSEGRLCVRFFRRADGTVLTKDCPVGWQAVKRRVSRVATAAFSAIAGLITGVGGYNALQSAPQRTMGTVVTMGDVPTYPVVPGGISPATDAPVSVTGGWIRGETKMGKPVVPPAEQNRLRKRVGRTH